MKVHLCSPTIWRTSTVRKVVPIYSMASSLYSGRTCVKCSRMSLGPCIRAFALPGHFPMTRLRRPLNPIRQSGRRQYLTRMRGSSTWHHLRRRAPQPTLRCFLAPRPSRGSGGSTTVSATLTPSTMRVIRSLM